MTGAQADIAKDARSGARGRNPVRSALAGLGRASIAMVRPFVELSSLGVAVLWQASRPRNWRRTLIAEFMRQFHAVGVGSLFFILVSGVLIGLAMVFQFLYWLDLAGQTSLVGKIIVLVMIREVAPLLVALIIIGRCGSVNMVELGHMHASGQLRMLDAQGIDIFLFCILPRCLATALAMFCLTVVFIATALLTGYLGVSVMLTYKTTLIGFINDILAAIGAAEYALIVLKPVIMGGFISLITCTVGLSAEGRSRPASKVLPAGFVKSVLAVFLISGILTVLL
jgi:phospholipid/cholesterol/gamma-HCH transport system permease protein